MSAFLFLKMNFIHKSAFLCFHHLIVGAVLHLYSHYSYSLFASLFLLALISFKTEYFIRVSLLLTLDISSKSCNSVVCSSNFQQVFFILSFKCWKCRRQLVKFSLQACRLLLWVFQQLLAVCPTCLDICLQLSDVRSNASLHIGYKVLLLLNSCSSVWQLPFESLNFVMLVF